MLSTRPRVACSCAISCVDPRDFGDIRAAFEDAAQLRQKLGQRVLVGPDPVADETEVLYLDASASGGRVFAMETS